MHLIKDSLPAVFVAFALAACTDEPGLPDSMPADAAPAESSIATSQCGDGGAFRARLSGALDANLDWRGTELACESMLRPDDKGMRLRFSGTVGSERLAVIIAMPTLEAGATGPEFDSVVTITVEGTGRFFSTPKLGSCWTDVRTNAPAGDAAYTVAGSLSCVLPLGELNGSAYVDVHEMRFHSLADWSRT